MGTIISAQTVNSVRASPLFESKGPTNRLSKYGGLHAVADHQLQLRRGRVRVLHRAVRPALGAALLLVFWSLVVRHRWLQQSKTDADESKKDK